MGRRHLFLALACAALALAPSVTALTPPPPKAVPMGPELALVPGPADEPTLAAFPDGGFAAVWRDPEWRVLLQLFDVHGVPRTEALTVGTAVLPVPFVDTAPDVAVLGDGSVVVAWVAGACPPGADVAAECGAAVVHSHYSPAGESLGTLPVTEIGLPGTAPAVAALPGLAPDAFVVVWTVENPVEDGCFEGCNYSDVAGRVWLSPETPIGPTFQVNEGLVEEQNAGDVAATADHGFIVVWDSWEGERFYDVFRRRFRVDGAPLEGQVQVNDPAFAGLRQFDPSVAGLASGSHVVVWSDNSRHDGGSGVYSIIGRLFDAAGMPEGFEFVAHDEDAAVHHHEPSVVAGLGDDFVVTGSEVDQAGSTSSVFASYFTAYAFSFGALLLDQPLPLQSAGDQFAPTLAFGGESWVAAWLSRPEADAVAAVRGRRIGFPSCTGLCLDDRFSIEVAWEDFKGRRGVGHGVVRGDDWVTFWFFRPDNVELAVKVLDARTVNGRFWAFLGSLSNVGYSVQVTDVLTGNGLQWINPEGTFSSRADARTLAAPVPAGAVAAGRPAPAPGPVAAAGRPLAPAPAATCPPSAVCVLGDRFEVAARWRNAAGDWKAAEVVPLTPDTARLWFFRPGNPELVVKVLDGRAVNGHFWVFYASLTDVEFELTVSDLESGDQVTYPNPPGHLASRGDAAAFDGE